METSPQKENGFTPIANEILEALARTKFTELETQALFLIFRNTYGWNRKVWEIRRWKVFEQIGITPNRIKDTLYKLADRNIIHLDWQAKTISFQKDYSIWQSLLSTKKIKTKLKNQGIIKDKKVDESVNFEKLTNRSSKSCPIGQVGVDESVNFGSCKPNGDIALPEPKERFKEISKEKLSNNMISTVPENEWKYEGWREHFDIGKKFIEEQNNFFFSNVLKGNITDEQLRMIAFIGSKGGDGRAVVKDKAGKATNQINIISWAYDELSGNGKPGGDNGKKPLKDDSHIFTLTDEQHKEAKEEEKRRIKRIRAEQEAKAKQRQELAEKLLEERGE